MDMKNDDFKRRYITCMYIYIYIYVCLFAVIPVFPKIIVYTDLTNTCSLFPVGELQSLPVYTASEPTTSSL